MDQLTQLTGDHHRQLLADAGRSVPPTAWPRWPGPPAAPNAPNGALRRAARQARRLAAQLPAQAASDQ